MLMLERPDEVSAALVTIADQAHVPNRRSTDETRIGYDQAA
jgi:hypothetical protein